MEIACIMLSIIAIITAYIAMGIAINAAAERNENDRLSRKD